MVDFKRWLWPAIDDQEIMNSTLFWAKVFCENQKESVGYF